MLKEVAVVKIEDNIKATLKREMDKRGVNYAGLSTQLGIPRATLRGYLKGSSHPRSDSLEQLADKLGISLAELVSGEEYPRSTGISCLDYVLMEIPALNPHVLPIAKEAVSLLRSLFLLSDDLRGIEEADTDAGCPNTVYSYCLHELYDPFQHTPAYGILVKRRSGKRWSTVALVVPFSSDKLAVLDLIDRCTKLQLSPEHLLDVVHDFLALQAGTA